MKLISLAVAALLGLGASQAAAQSVAADSLPPLPRGAQNQPLRRLDQQRFRKLAAMLATGVGKRKIQIQVNEVPEYRSGHCGH